MTQIRDAATSIDRLPRAEALAAMLESHRAAVATVAGALGPIGAAAELVARVLAAGGGLHYGAAGSSGLMALADACELPGTFGIAQSRIRISMAGGVPQDGVMPGDVEDDAEAATRAARELSCNDAAIVLSASGTTPYALAFARQAQAGGAAVIALANAVSAPLFEHADIAIALPTAPEVVDGSTRLGAGTAQKVALNMISTQAGILLGHVHDGLMINFKPDNAKLRARAAGVVARIAAVDAARAHQALMQSGYDTKLAILIAGGEPVDRARQRLRDSDGRLDACLGDPGA